MARRGRGRGVIEAPEEEKKNEISYMQPEIMPLQIMEDILRQKGMSISILQKADRKVIVRNFYKHISPKYQRDYRENRRGKILKKMRQRREKKMEEEDWKKLVGDSKGKSSSSYSSPGVVSSSRDRLKPPPSSSTFKRAPVNLDDIVIKEHKVKSHSSETNKDSNDGDKDKRKSDNSDKDSKKIKIDHSSEKRPSDSDSNGSGKKLKLKRSSIQFP